MMLWAAILAGSSGCFGLKLAGLSVPEHVLRNPRVERVSALLPIALLATLIATQTVSTGHHLSIDARAAGLAAAVGAQLLRAPFLVVVGTAALVTALIHLIG